jgi:protein-tyrosine phosphatase
MIDLHSHILPDLDDGPSTWEESLQMARMAVADGIRTIAATPHLFKKHPDDLPTLISKEEVVNKISEFRERLQAEAIDLEVVPGCDFPLSSESLQLLEDDQVLTINGGKHYLLLEFPFFALPPASEEICFRLKSKGITPIITHPERYFFFIERPEKLERFLKLGCLVQITGSSLTGGFGRQVARTAREMLRKDYCQVLASDAHNVRKRPPLLREAVEEAASLLGRERALAMVTTTPAMILRGDPCL